MSVDDVDVKVRCNHPEHYAIFASSTTRLTTLAALAETWPLRQREHERNPPTLAKYPASQGTHAFA